MITNQRVLIIGFVWPEPNSSAAGGRMVQLIRIFKQQGYEVTFASSASDSDYMIDLNTLGVSKKSITLNCSSFDVFVKEFRIASLRPIFLLFQLQSAEELK